MRGRVGCRLIAANYTFLFLSRRRNVKGKESGELRERRGEEKSGEEKRQEERRVTLSFLFPPFRAVYGHHPLPLLHPSLSFSVSLSSATPFFKYSVQEKQPLARVFAFRAKLLLRPVNSLSPTQSRMSLGRSMTKERKREEERERER